MYLVVSFGQKCMYNLFPSFHTFNNSSQLENVIPGTCKFFQKDKGLCVVLVARVQKSEGYTFPSQIVRQHTQKGASLLQSHLAVDKILKSIHTLCKLEKR